MAKLINLGGEPRETPFQDLCRIGRDEGNEIILDDAGVSRRHCRITREGEDYILEDLKSANGTFRGEERIDRVKLADGDRIRVGRTELLFASAAEAAAGGEAARAGQAQYVLIFCRGERAGERVRFAGERLTFGRRSSNTVVLKDAKVSGVHAELVLEQGRPVLKDLGSTNGTFLEGKRIDEIVLDHGDRVVMGESEFVLADAAQGDPPLPAAEPDEGAHTLINVPTVRVVQNVAGAERRGPLALVGLLLLLAALGGAGWFYWHVRRASSEAPAAPAAAGNLLGERWSFEISESAPAPGTAWDLGGGDASGAAFQLTTTAVRSGQQALLARPSGSEAVALLRDGMRVSGRTLRISGYARTSDEAVAVLAAQFSSAADESYRVLVQVGSSAVADWRQISAELAPPAGATQLALVLVASGSSGEVVFDDLVVEEGGPGRATVASINQFEFERAGEHLLVRRGADLLRMGALLLEVAEGGSARAADRFLHNGALLLPGGAAAAYASAFATDARSASWRVEWQAPGATARLPITLLPALTEEPVGVVAGGRLEPYRDSFEADAVTGLVLGKGTTRMRLAFEPEVQVEAARGAEVYQLVLRPAAERVVVRMQVDFVEEKTQATELAGKARAAQQAGRLGEALTILDRVTNEFPFDEGILAEADNRRKEIIRERERYAARLDAAVERARFLRSPAAYLEAEEDARAAAAALAGTASAGEFQGTEVELASERQTLVQSAREREAELLLRRLETALAEQPARERVAREIAAFLREFYPGSEPARRAQERIEER
ncbi:MAG: FHA domain-containing protein [Planctomycetes bacterium]|nr:FHA domain-containing protein [Planctomycetota bacterium]